MSIMTKRLIILAILIIVGIVLGRLAVRGFMNLLMVALCLGVTSYDERRE